MRETITRTELFAFVRSLGAEWTDVQSITIDPRGVTVTSLRRDGEGRTFLHGDDVATEATQLGIVGEVDVDTVRMKHPKLDAVVQVPASSAGHHATAGWEVIDEQAKPAAPPGEPEPVHAPTEGDQQQPEQPAPDNAEQTSPKRRRTAKDGE